MRWVAVLRARQLHVVAIQHHKHLIPGLRSGEVFALKLELDRLLPVILHGAVLEVRLVVREEGLPAAGLFFPAERTALFSDILRTCRIARSGSRWSYTACPFTVQVGVLPGPALLQAEDPRKRDETADSGEDLHLQLLKAMILTPVELPAVAHTEAESDLLRKLHEPCADRAGWQAVEDEEVDPEVVELSLIKGHVRVVLCVPARVEIEHTWYEIIEGLTTAILIRQHELHVLRELRPRYIDEALELFSSEAEIDVVVPGDEALMAYRTEERTGIDEVRDAVTITDRLHGLQDFQMRLMDPLRVLMTGTPL